MLNAKEIHFLIEQELNIGSFTQRGYDEVEIDAAINHVTYRLYDEIVSKQQNRDILGEKGSILSNTEQLFIRSLNKYECFSVVDGKFKLPDDFSSVVNGTITTYTECVGDVSAIVNGVSYKATGDVLYNNVWYKKGDVFVGGQITTVYGNANTIKLITKKENAIEINSILFNSYTSKSIFSVIGNEIYVKSKDIISKFCMNYVMKISKFKIDSCNNITLNFPEEVQHWIIDKVILRLMNRDEETQQKIVNFSSL
jgi:hypothetical protein